jgi:hypothetical protein
MKYLHQEGVVHEADEIRLSALNLIRELIDETGSIT